jgi:hypothetical protein
LSSIANCRKYCGSGGLLESRPAQDFPDISFPNLFSRPSSPFSPSAASRIRETHSLLRVVSLRSTAQGDVKNLTELRVGRFGRKHSTVQRTLDRLNTYRLVSELSCSASDRRVPLLSLVLRLRMCRMH